MSRARLPQLHSITDGSFEPNRKNPIMLGDDAELNKDSKPIKIGEESSILELSSDSLIIRGALEFDTLLRGVLDSPNERMAFTAKTGEYRWYSTNNDEDYVRMYVLGGNCLLQAVDASGGVEANIHLDAGNDVLLDATTGLFQFYLDGGTTNPFTITLEGSGVTTLTTTDSDGTAGHLTLQPDGDLVLDPVSQKTIINATDKLYFDGGTDTYIYENAADSLKFFVGDVNLLHLVEAGGGVSDKVSIPSLTGLYFDGGGDTYIYQQAADVLRIVVGGDVIMHISEKGDDGNEVSFGSSCVGFTQIEPTYDASITVVDFRFSNKQNLTFGSGDITNVVLTFPLVSGNFQLLIKQDGTGSRTVTNWKAAEFDESAADGEQTVKWAGGSNPTLTTDANHVDILSFYWDADNEIAYGVATLDFQF